MAICDTFMSLSRGTWRLLRRGERQEYQVHEETITEMNMLRIKEQNSTEVTTEVFNKRVEGINGADWQCWFTGSTGQWLGLRVQAKVLSYVSDRYEHLHYRDARGYQSNRLYSQAQADNMLPMYCLYSYHSGPLAVNWPCPTYRQSSELLGCTLLPFTEYVALRNRNADEWAHVLPHVFPWHCLVCCSRCGGTDLPTRAYAYLKQNHFLRSEGGDKPVDFKYFQPHSSPPDYVTKLLEGELKRPPDPGTRGITVIRQEHETTSLDGCKS